MPARCVLRAPAWGLSAGHVRAFELGGRRELCQSLRPAEQRRLPCRNVSWPYFVISAKADRKWKGIPATIPTVRGAACARRGQEGRSEEHTSELQSLMRISYAVFCLKKKKQNTE